MQCHNPTDNCNSCDNTLIFLLGETFLLNDMRISCGRNEFRINFGVNKIEFFYNYFTFLNSFFVYYEFHRHVKNGAFQCFWYRDVEDY